MQSLAFDVAHLLAGTMLVLSFVLLYQDRVTAVLNVFALQAITLALSVGWQSIAQNAPHLIVTALVALVVKGFIIPAALHRIVRKLEIHREIEQVIGGGPTLADRSRPGRAVDPAGRAGGRERRHDRTRGPRLRARRGAARPADDDHP